MLTFKDISGQRFGRLVALEPQIATHVRGNMRWLCQCDCGNQKIVYGHLLAAGTTRSCRCLQAEARLQRFTTHGHTRAGKPTRTFRSWEAMLKRCFNRNSEHWPGYGGRGITVCERWLSFVNFLADMGERPPGKTLDRKDNDGNYEKSNCRWATPLEQASNRRSRSIKHKCPVVRPDRQTFG